jgi:serine/tyrosine/threonine adenylyltransferase
MAIAFDNSYQRELEGLYLPVTGAPAPAPHLLLLNLPLAEELGLEAAFLHSPEGALMLTGAALPAGASGIAMAYAGHQFGGFSPQLGDGRAMLLGEVLDRTGTRRDIHLKGSGPTPFSRGGDGKAGLGPVLREYLMGEAMAALGVPTTRALAATTTGEQVYRQRLEPGAVLARVASSHIRVGTFQFFFARGDIARLRKLADYTIARHDPACAGAADRYLRFLDAVIARQAELIAQWMAVGFIHGVMNTDNCAISGETIDYGPCAFLDGYDPGAVFSSIDHGGRYAYANQPVLARWNLARLAETLTPLIAPENPQEALGDLRPMIEGAEARFEAALARRMAAKLGLDAPDPALVDGFLDMLRGSDFTQGFRHLGAAARGGDEALALHLGAGERLEAWLGAWRGALDRQAGGPEAAIARMDAANPVYIPRNHAVEAALDAAITGDMAPFLRLLSVLADPFTLQPGNDDLIGPAPEGLPPHVTYCGT